MKPTPKTSAAGKDNNLILFEEYIKDKKIVIADQHSSSRVGLARILTGLGAFGPNIITAVTYEQAVAEIEKHNPHIVVCDYDLGKKNGIELLQSMKKQCPDLSKSLFIVVTGNTSQSAVAQAAEEDVDTFVLKPYTIEIIRRCILKAAISKLFPSEYSKKIDEGKKLLLEAKPTEAKAVFQEACKLDAKPSLAHFYIGQAEEMEKALENAMGAYNDGLAFNKIHYKCMTGLFDVLMGKQKVHEAYDVVKRISRYFPANPQRLSQVLKLAILTRSYDDVERYYQAFVDLDARNEELIRYICAALVVCGKYYITTNNMSRGLDLFKKASITGTGKVKILREIIIALCENGMHKQANEYLNRFPMELRSGVDYQAMSYLVGSGELATTQTISMGRELVSKGVHDPYIFQTLIKKSIEGGYRESAGEYLQDAQKKYPEMAATWDKLSKEMMATPAKKDAS